jgi:DNA-binding GntR family transcriptional regulator
VAVLDELELRHVTPDDSRPLSLADEAYAALRGRIVNCRLAPGLRVTEKQLSAELGIGLTPVRQALARLDTEGLVRTLPRRCYQVAPLTIQSVDDLFQVWRILGPAIAELAAQKVSARARAELTARFGTRLALAPRDGDVSAFVQDMDEYWTALAEAAGNRRLAGLYVGLAGELRRVFTLIYQNPDAATALATLAEFEVWDALGDQAMARGVSEQFIDTAHGAVLKVLMSWPSVVQAEVIPPVPWFFN